MIRMPPSPDFSKAVELSPQFSLGFNNRGNARKAKEM